MNVLDVCLHEPEICISSLILIHKLQYSLAMHLALNQYGMIKIKCVFLGLLS